MKFSIAVSDLKKQHTGIQIQPIFEGIGAKRGRIRWVDDRTHTQRDLLVGCGPRQAFNKNACREVLAKVFESLIASDAVDATLALGAFVGDDRTLEWCLQQAVFLFHEALYTLDTFKQKKKDPCQLKQFTFLVPAKKALTSLRAVLDESLAIAEGVTYTKNLANLPPNVCTPLYLANEAKRFAKAHPDVQVRVLEKKELEKLKMGSLLSVAQGSIHPPKFITLSYCGTRKSQKPIVLVGKGITFDTGGNSLKPAASMIGMKYDMSGAASIYGVFCAVEKLRLPIHLIGVIPACENMPGPYASRPDDVVTSMSGKTIEILNTDAEGRLILADALTYVERLNPAAVIDLATLTGACIIALGHHYSGLMGNQDWLKQQLLNAGKQVNDPAWELPLGEEYTQSLQSEIADLANIAGPDVGAGTIVAGCFLSQFTKKYPWAHLDIAGTACFFSGSKRGASGRPVPLLIQYLINLTKEH